MGEKTIYSKIHPGRVQRSSAASSPLKWTYRRSTVALIDIFPTHLCNLEGDHKLNNDGGIRRIQYETLIEEVQMERTQRRTYYSR